jgi:hypothetical protein
MAALRDWIVDRADRDIFAHAPSREMRPRGDLAEPRNSPAQFCLIGHRGDQF